MKETLYFEGLSSSLIVDSQSYSTSDFNHKLKDTIVSAASRITLQTSPDFSDIPIQDDPSPLQSESPTPETEAEVNWWYVGGSSAFFAVATLLVGWKIFSKMKRVVVVQGQNGNGVLEPGMTEEQEDSVLGQYRPEVKEARKRARTNGSQPSSYPH